MDEIESRFISSQRVAHLASADGTGAPHVVTICFVLEAGVIYTAIDAKPKRVDAMKLRRVRNIIENPNVALVFDRYSEDWNRTGDAACWVSGNQNRTKASCFMGQPRTR